MMERKVDGWVNRSVDAFEELLGFGLRLAGGVFALPHTRVVWLYGAWLVMRACLPRLVTGSLDLVRKANERR